MKAFICTHGDPSVGIHGVSTEIDLQYDYDNDERSWVRDTLHKCFTELYGEPAEVWFNDECSTCHNRLESDGKCKNKSCPESITEKDVQNAVDNILGNSP
jgi:hypothetical protein